MKDHPVHTCTPKNGKIKKNKCSDKYNTPPERKCQEGKAGRCGCTAFLMQNAKCRMNVCDETYVKVSLPFPCNPHKYSLQKH